MIPNVVKGSNVRGLMRYLTGPGRANEHTNPHVTAGDGFLVAWHEAHELDRAAADEIAAYLDEPHRVFGTEFRSQITQQHPETGERIAVRDNAGRPVYRDQPVWHCSLSLPPREGPLSAERWDAICSDFADAMGFTEASGKAPCRWVAIHHGASKNGNDHVHLVASMVREDGTKWDGLFRDWSRAQQSCRDLEAKYGLTPVEGRQHGTAGRGTRPVEEAVASRVGRERPARAELADRLRSCAVASRTEAEWLRRVRAAGVVIKPRFAAGTTDVVVGYRAALRIDGHRLDFYGGGQIARDLTLPRVRESWDEPDLPAAAEASAEWQAAFRGSPTGTRGRETAQFSPDAGEVVGRRLREATDRLVATPLTDRAAWADAARDTAGALSSWAVLDPANRTPLQQAATVIARTAQMPRAGTSRRTPNNTGVATLLLAAARDDRGKLAAEVLLAQLIRTAAALAAYHREAGNLREADRLRTNAVHQLQRLDLRGYAGPVGMKPRRQTRDASPVHRPPPPLPTKLTPRAPTTTRTTQGKGRNEDRDGR